MEHIITGLDRSKLAHICHHYGLEFDRIIPYISKYESEMMKRQHRNLDKK